MGRQSWGLLPKVSTSSAAITTDTLPPYYAQYFDDGTHKRLFFNIGDTIVSMSAEGDADDLIIGGQSNGDLLYYNGANWTRLAIGTSSQWLRGGTVPSFAAISGPGIIQDSDAVGIASAAFVYTLSSTWYDVPGASVALTMANAGSIMASFSGRGQVKIGETLIIV